MAFIDPQKADGVWRRVQGGISDGEDLVSMAALKAGDGAVLLQLSQRFSGKEAAALQKLSAQAICHEACLRGIYQLLTGRYLPPAPATQPVGENTQGALRRCYGRGLQCIAEYETRSGDPQFGFVFTQLAQQEKEACQALLTLLGNLEF